MLAAAPGLQVRRCERGGEWGEGRQGRRLVAVAAVLWPCSTCMLRPGAPPPPTHTHTLLSSRPLLPTPCLLSFKSSVWPPSVATSVGARVPPWAVQTAVSIVFAEFRSPGAGAAAPRAAPSSFIPDEGLAARNRVSLGRKRVWWRT
jgi:hypothetical protein